MENRNKRIFLNITSKVVWLRVLFLALLQLTVAPQLLSAEDEQKDLGGFDRIFDPKVERREIEREAIDTENWEIGGYYGIISIEDFGSSELVGIRVAYHVTEDFFIEMSYAKTEAGKTSFENLLGNIQFLLLPDGKREYIDYDVALGFNLLPGEAFVGDELAFSSSMYLVVGLGATKFANETHSTIMIGGGYRVLFTDWFAMHLTLKDHFYDTELTGVAKTVNDLEISTSFTIFF